MKLNSFLLNEFMCLAPARTQGLQERGEAEVSNRAVRRVRELEAAFSVVTAP